jgi:hypothetical protein
LIKTKWDKSEVLLGTSCLGGGETTWELGNLLGTYFKHIGNKESTKNSLPWPKKKKNSGPCMLSLLIGCMKLLFPKLFVAIFGLGTNSVGLC